jgi:drug/metabolite transporter (DMT)-like permease
MTEGQPPPVLRTSSAKNYQARSFIFGRGKVGIALLAAILAVSTASIFIRYAQVEAPSLVIAALRLAFATVLLAPVALIRHRDELKRLTRREIVFGVISGLFLAAHFASWITSLEYTTVASSVVFVATGPLWVAILSPMLLNERLTRTAVIGLIIAFLGGTIIGLSDACIWNGGLRCPDLAQVMHGRAMWGNFLALVGAWTVSGYLIMGRKLRANISLIPYIFVVYGIAAIALMVIVVAVYKNPFQYAAPAYLWIFLLALIPQLIGHSTFNWLLKYLSATMVAVTTLAEPVGSTVLAYFLLHEIPSFEVVLGGALILIGIYLTSTQGGKS